MDRRQKTVAAALSGLMMGAMALTSCTPAANEVKGECYGVNGCKGKGACGGPGHECAGKNECKGKGFVSMTEKECQDKMGTFKKM